MLRGTSWVVGLVSLGCLVAVSSLFAAEEEAAGPTPSVGAAFAQAHAALREYRRTPLGRMSGLGGIMRSEPFKELAALGPKAVPLAVAKLDESPSREWPMRNLLGVVTRRFFSPEQLRSCRSSRDRADLWANWLKAGQAGVNERVGAFLDKGDTESVWKEGIAALVPLMDMLAEGNLDALPVVERLLTREVKPIMPKLVGEEEALAGDTPEARADACLAWWEANKEDWIVPFPDTVAAREKAAAKAAAEAEAAAEQ